MTHDLPQTLGQYQLLRPLARGGMAELVVARRRDANGTEVVLKCLRVPLESDPQRSAVRMFLDEARISTLLDHPNVVKVFEVDYQDGIYFLVMEKLHGWDLSRVFDSCAASGKLLPLPLVARLVATAARGLDAAHRCCTPRGELLNLVHRDISPANIFVTEDGTLKILDFGVAKSSIQISETQAGFIKGKVSYMSPEQARGEHLDRRSDIFSLGVVMHELITGRRLFHRQRPLEALHAVVEEFIPPPARSNEVVPEALMMVAMRMLQRDRDLRFTFAAELADALDLALPTSREITRAMIAGELSAVFAGDDGPTVAASPAQASIEELSAWANTMVGILRPRLDSVGPMERARRAKPPAPTEHRDTQPTPAVGGSAQAATTPWEDTNPTAPSPGPTFAGPTPNEVGELLAFSPEDTQPVDATREAVAPTAAIPEDTIPVSSPETRALPPPTRDTRLAAARPPAVRRRATLAKPPKRTLIALGLAAAFLATVAVVVASQLGPATPEPTANPATPGVNPVAASPTRKDPSPDLRLAPERTVPGRAAAPPEPGAASIAVADDEPVDDREPESAAAVRPGRSPRVGRNTDGPSTKRHAAAAAKRSQRLGRVTLDASPWANVYLGQRLLGATPLVEITLPVGRQTLRLENPETGATRAVTLDVPEEGLLRHTVSMD